MWASALTTSRLIARGKQSLWLGGALGGIIEEKFGLTYSQGIAITWPKYLLTCYQEYITILKSFAINVMNISPENKSCDEIAYEGVKAFQETLLELGVANTILDLGLQTCEISEMSDNIERFASKNVMTKEDIKTIIQLSIGG